MQVSTAVANAANDAIETTIGASPTLTIYDGAMPANCAAAAVGTVVAVMALPADWMGNAASAIKSLSGTWQDTSADNAGLARYARITQGATCHAQFLLSEAYANSRAYSVGQHVSNGNGIYRCTTAGTSAASGAGPAGTGAGITDGTAVFAFVQTVVELTMASTSVASGAQFTISALTLSLAAWV